MQLFLKPIAMLMRVPGPFPLESRIHLLILYVYGLMYVCHNLERKACACSRLTPGHFRHRYSISSPESLKIWAPDSRGAITLLRIGGFPALARLPSVLRFKMVMRHMRSTYVLFDPLLQLRVRPVQSGLSLCIAIIHYRNRHAQQLRKPQRILSRPNVRETRVDTS